MYLVSLCFLCAAHTLNCLARNFLLFPPATVFSSFCLLKYLYSLPGGLLLRPLDVGCFSVQCNSSELDSFGFWIVISETLHFMQEVFILYFLFVLSLLYTNALKSAQFNRYIWSFESFSQNWVITEILVCHIIVLHEFIVLGNCVSFLYFQFCSSLFPSSLHYCCIMDHTFQLHNPCVHLDYYVTFPLECWLPCFQVVDFMF